LATILSPVPSAATASVQAEVDRRPTFGTGTFWGISGHQIDDDAHGQRQGNSKPIGHLTSERTHSNTKAYSPGKQR